ncbi:nucleotidyltransferase domain-containing protein [Methylobacterium sp. JK268]
MTLPNGADDPILAEFREALRDAYGDRIARVLLFGSRARGDARPDSDYDVALFLSDLGEPWAEIDRIDAIAAALRQRTGADIRTQLFPAEDWPKRTPILHEIRHQGRPL